MAVSREDVLHVAELARLDVPAERLDQLVGELNGILSHMEVLQRIETPGSAHTISGNGDSTPMRSDSSGPLSLHTPRESIAPSMRDGFFLVPRLGTHEDPPASSS